MAQYLLLSFKDQVPPLGKGRNIEEVVRNASRDAVSAKIFPISPELARFTSTDQLMSIADEISKLDSVAYSILNRTSRSIIDLQRKIKADVEFGWGDLCPTDNFPSVVPPEMLVELEDGNDAEPIKIDEAIERWEWNESMISSHRAISDIFSQLSNEVQRMDDDVRTSSNSFTDSLNKLSNLRRRNEGSLMVRSLDPVGSKMQLVTSLDEYIATRAVKAPIYVKTRHLTTILVVVKRSSAIEFEKGFHLGSDFVVPNSCQKIEEDSEYMCYSVTLKVWNLDEYKDQAKEKGWYVRDFTYEPSMREKMRNEAKDTINMYLEECEKFKDIIERTFSHMSIVWIHIRAFRVFVESTLLYGISNKFTAFLLKASPKAVTRIHFELERIFGDGMSNEDETPIDENEYHSYVSFPFSIMGLN